MKKLLVISLVLSWLATWANAGLELNLNTGVDSGGGLITPGTQGGAYTVYSAPSPLITGGAAYVVQPGYPIPPWYIPAGTGAQWISIDASGGNPAAPGGEYIYRITFNLPASAVPSAKITGQWTTDNAGNDIQINGASTGQEIAYGDPGKYSFLNPHPFSVLSGFKEGNNTLDFLVYNGNDTVQDTAGPTGLYVQATLTAVPEPGTYIAGLGALALVGLINSRRSRVIRIGK
jgi:hypothetical protein